MIGVIDVECQAANPNMPLHPMRAFVSSPSSIRVRNVPRRIGDWCIRNVYFTAIYPDGTIKTANCVLVGGVWVGTIEGTTTSGISQNGYTIFADGTDENGNNVTGYILGKGDIEILDADGTLKPDTVRYYVHLLSAEADTPKEGDMWPTSDGYVIWQDGIAHALAGIPDHIVDLSGNVINANMDVTQYREYLGWQLEYDGKTYLFEGDKSYATYTPEELHEYDYKWVLDNSLTDAPWLYGEYWEDGEWRADIAREGVVEDVFGNKIVFNDISALWYYPAAMQDVIATEGWANGKFELKDTSYPKSETSSATEISNALDSKADASTLSSYIPYTIDSDGNPTSLTIGNRIEGSTVGTCSFSSGVNNNSSGVCTTTLGFANSATTTYATTIGSSNVASKDVATAIGYSNLADGKFATAIGNNNLISANYGTAIGSYGTISGAFGITMGLKSTAKDIGSYVWNAAKRATFSGTSEYVSHGTGTFNINPISGLNGIYVGETNLGEYLASLEARISALEGGNG